VLTRAIKPKQSQDLYVACSRMRLTVNLQRQSIKNVSRCLSNKLLPQGPTSFSLCGIVGGALLKPAEKEPPWNRVSSKFVPFEPPRRYSSLNGTFQLSDIGWIKKTGSHVIC